MDDTPPAQQSNHRRAYQRPRRTRTIHLSFNEQEYAQVSEAAGRARMAPGAFAAHTILTVVSNTYQPETALLRDLLAETVHLSTQVRRAGVNLNQAVTVLQATGQLPPELAHYAAYAHRIMNRVDEFAEQIRQRLP